MRRSLAERHSIDKTIMSKSCWQPEWVRQEIIKFSFATASSLVYFCDRSAGWQRLNKPQILHYFIYTPHATTAFGFFIDLNDLFYKRAFLCSIYLTSEILQTYLHDVKMSASTNGNKHSAKISCSITGFRSAGQDSKHHCVTCHSKLRNSSCVKLSL